MVIVVILAALVAAAAVICLQITVTDTPHKTAFFVVLRKKLKTNLCWGMLASKQFRMLLSSRLLFKNEKSTYTKLLMYHVFHTGLEVSLSAYIEGDSEQDAEENVF
jgi:hypothetical protein